MAIVMTKVTMAQDMFDMGINDINNNGNRYTLLDDGGEIGPRVVQGTDVCGTSGSISARIEDCARYDHSIRGVFMVVTRLKIDENIIEVYLDTKSGLLWSERVSRRNFYEARETCASKIVEMGNLNLSWRLPTEAEFIRARSHKILTKLPNMFRKLYWSSTENPFNKMQAWLFSGGGNTGYMTRRNDFDSKQYSYVSVRCVARE